MPLLFECSGGDDGELAVDDALDVSLLLLTFWLPLLEFDTW